MHGRKKKCDQIESNAMKRKLYHASEFNVHTRTDIQYYKYFYKQPEAKRETCSCDLMTQIAKAAPSQMAPHGSLDSQTLFYFANRQTLQRKKKLTVNIYQSYRNLKFKIKTF